MLLIEESCLGLFQPIESIGRGRVSGLVGVNEERLLAVLYFDVFLWDTGLQVQDSVAKVG